MCKLHNGLFYMLELHCMYSLLNWVLSLWCQLHSMWFSMFSMLKCNYMYNLCISKPDSFRRVVCMLCSFHLLGHYFEFLSKLFSRVPNMYLRYSMYSM